MSSLIRRAMLADVPALADFAARTFKETFADANSAEDMDAHLDAAFGIPQQTREVEDVGTITLVAHRAETLVAFAQIRRSRPPSCIDADLPVESPSFWVETGRPTV